MTSTTKIFDEVIYPTLLKRLGEKNIHYTKSENKPNWVKIEGDSILVKTGKSNPDYLEVSREGQFQKTWDLLIKHGTVTQAELSRKYNIKRSAFMLIAFDLLDEVEYKAQNNSLTLLI